ncbi:hypothetical protein Taro_043316 [Colocasia esculenta]|uniref:Uncharacterized protein n=1 Tax=Colocasia esculenta TaxID=4460 RepID=A0A843WJ37_COLES|nr:hypothetical protein [Colocasia esculenta]
MYDNSQRLEELLHTRLSTMQTQLRSNLSAMESRLKTIESLLLPIPPPPPGSSGVDTRSSSQKTCLSVLDSVSTQPEVVSTLVTLPREPILPVWDSVSTHSLDRSTHSEKFFTLSSTWTCGTLGFTWIGLGSCSHAPQGYFWTHWAINTLQLAIQPKRTFQSLPEIRLAAGSVLLLVLALLVLP